MPKYSRREILKMLAVIFPVSFLGGGKKDIFEQELVCVHIFDKIISIPEPLLKKFKDIPVRSNFESYFNVEIPELVLCSARVSFLDIFQYFWPITRDEFERIYDFISVEFKKIEIIGKKDISDFSDYLRTETGKLKAANSRSTLILTYNDYTRYWIPELISLWKNSDVDELVIFKNPTLSPYLCDFESMQKGFKRPP